MPETSPDSLTSLTEPQYQWRLLLRTGTPQYKSAQLVEAGEPTPPLPTGISAEAYAYVKVFALEGYSPEPVPKTARDILLAMRAMFGSQPLPVQYEFKQVVAEVQAAAESGNVLLMKYIIERLDFTTSTTVSVAQGVQFKQAFLSCF
jgi:hypothetical protein